MAVRTGAGTRYVLLGLLVLGMMAASSHAWTYSRTDTAAGPSAWSSSDSRCAGSSQSPIDLPSSGSSTGAALISATLPAITFNYNNSLTPSVTTSSDTSVRLTGFPVATMAGYDAQVVTDGPFTGSYYLSEIQFHAPSEHTIDGASYALEMQLYHTNLDSSRAGDSSVLQQAAISILFAEQSVETDSEPTEFLSSLETLLSTWFASPTFSPTAVLVNLTAVPLATASFHLLNFSESFGTSYITYHGSLTTPNCRETVSWAVMDTPLTVSGSSLELLRRAMGSSSTNRPRQSSLARSISIGQVALAVVEEEPELSDKDVEVGYGMLWLFVTSILVVVAFVAVVKLRDWCVRRKAAAEEAREHAEEHVPLKVPRLAPLPSSPLDAGQRASIKM